MNLTELHLEMKKEEKTLFALDVKQMEENFFDNTTLIGIGCVHEPHKIALLLNAYFGLELERKPELDIPLKHKSDVVYFSVFEYCEQNTYTRHLLYHIKQWDHRLLPELRQLDYIWTIRSEDQEGLLDTYTSELGNLPGVQLSTILSLSHLKHEKHLIV